MARELVISADNDGRRVDRVLRTLWPGVPLGAIMKAIRTGEVRLDGKRTKGEARLAEGQRAVFNAMYFVVYPRVLASTLYSVSR